MGEKHGVDYFQHWTHILHLSSSVRLHQNRYGFPKSAIAFVGTNVFSSFFERRFRMNLCKIFQPMGLSGVIGGMKCDQTKAVDLWMVFAPCPLPTCSACKGFSMAIDIAFEILLTEFEVIAGFIFVERWKVLAKQDMLRILGLYV